MKNLFDIGFTKDDKDRKYSSIAGVHRLWEKADILPLFSAVLIENEYGRASINKN